MPDILNRLLAPTNLLSVALAIGALLLWLGIRRGFIAYECANLREGKRSSVAQVLYDTAKYSILFGTMLTVLQINHVDVSSMVAGLGIASAIVGLALQDVLKDSIMGIHMMADHFFEVGDVVRYGEFEGIVVSFNINTTKLQSIYDRSIMTICNRNISQIVKLSNWMDIDLNLAYEEKPEKVHATLSKICEKISRVDGIEDCIYKGTQSFEESAVIYKLRLICPPENRPELHRAAMRLIQEELERANIRIPYRQLDIHSSPVP